MTKSFSEIYRILKPGRWITIEFHNSKNAIWTAIQEAIGVSGFIVADVRLRQFLNVLISYLVTCFGKVDNL